MNDGIDQLKKKPNGSSVWISLSKLFWYLHERNIVSFLCLRKCIGNGEGTRSWWKIGWAMVFLWRNFLVFLFHGIKKECLVSDKLVNGQWVWNWNRVVREGVLQQLNFWFLSLVFRR